MQVLTPTFAFMLSALIPCLYLLVLQLRNRRASAVWLLFTLSTLINALASFWWIDGWTFALKDSSGSLFLATSTLVSLLLGKPLFGVVLREYLQLDRQSKHAVEAFLQGPGQKLVVLSTRVLCLKGLTVATLNTLVKHQLVTAPFGTPEFNAQLAGAVAWMVPVAYLATTVAYSVIVLIWKVGLGAKLHFPFTPRVWTEALASRGL
ncbi:hypothetical protein GCM10008938_23040 [Deinococcus roseus]|uniref:Uncharacterized protein n=2 Tax=Deinococcus roseus TaxID=392414 RepID=A0ABQ2CZK8_9DEIO|nr:hypothetical protein GCM10008938_23040 [Deinococcus roseus]